MLLNKKLSIVNRWHHRSYGASAAVAFPYSDEFNVPKIADFKNDVYDGGSARLLNIRFIKSSENLYRSTCSSPPLNSLSDEGFASSSQESTNNDFYQSQEVKERTKTKSNDSMQEPFHIESQLTLYDFDSLHLSTDNYLSAVRAAVTGNSLQLLHLVSVLKVPVDAADLQGITLLHWAVKNDHAVVARLLLSLGANIRRTTVKGRSALHIAARNNATNCLKVLLKSFCEEEKDVANSNYFTARCKFLLQRDLNGDSVLHFACRLRRKKCLKILLTSIMKHSGWHIVEEMLQERNKCGHTPVHVACLWKSVEAVDLLLTNSLDKVVTKIYGSKDRNDISAALREASRRTLFWKIERGTVLHEMATMKCSCAGCCTSDYASSESKLGATELKMYLLGRCNAVETPEKRCTECDKAQSKLMKTILSCSSQLCFLRDVSGQTPLMCSVINDAVPLTKALLDCKDGEECMDPNFHTALHHAAARGRIRQVALLLEYGASPREQDNCGATPMHYAAVRGFCATVQRLYGAIEYNDNIRTTDGHSAFMWAAINGVEMSLRAMIDVNPSLCREDCDKHGCTALHLAAARDHANVIKLLLFLKWDYEKRNNLGETPIIVAAKSGSWNAVRCLLDVSADCFARDQFNNTALHLAARSNGNKEALHELLRYTDGTPLLDMQNQAGQSALHCAVQCNAVQCVRHLLSYGANPLIKDCRGWDALMLAIKQGCWSTITLMLKNSPNINCYSSADNQSTLSVAMEKKNYILASFLRMNGSLLADEIQDIAATTIQRWYRGHLVSRYQRHIITMTGTE